MNDDNKQPFTSQQKKELEETIKRAVWGTPQENLNLTWDGQLLFWFFMAAAIYSWISSFTS